MTSSAQDKKTISIKDIESFLQHAASCIETLRNAVSFLPKVDEKGNSDCPFAKELYEKKEKAQEEVASCIDRLHEYEKWTDDQIKRCLNNLTVISANADRLNSDLPRRDFTEAEAKAAALYKRLVRLRLKIRKAIKKCQKAIKEASQKKYPDAGEDGDYVSDDLSDSPEDESSDEQMDEFLHDMLRMGPVD
jgi:hypothetical protein